jgi:hypothetical protein
MSRELSLVLFWASLAFSECSSLMRDERYPGEHYPIELDLLIVIVCHDPLPQVPQIHCVAESLSGMCRVGSAVCMSCQD